MILNNLRDTAHSTAVEKGWHEKEVTHGESIALMHSELSEALEAIRKGRRLTPAKWPMPIFKAIYRPTDHDVPDQDEYKAVFESEVKDLPGDELADVIIRILDYCGKHDIDIDLHVKAKMLYNSGRSYRHGGKIF